MYHHWTDGVKIKDWLYEAKPSHVVEIGALEGQNTANLKEAMKDLKFKLTVISDDTDKKSDEVNYIRGVSYLKIPELEDNSVDFVLLDTDHNFWTMMKELLALHPKLKDDALLMIHDVDVFYYHSGESLFYADGTPYPKEEIHSASTKFGGMGHAVIDFLSQMKSFYKLEEWSSEFAGIAVIRKLPEDTVRLTLAPSYQNLEERKKVLTHA